ncbi:RNA polymerase subunit sigma [Brevirhabdus pacifica]|uniref:RNA polymerase subunit sigma n=1 Tax=Brevirhabdus pacifica TaxID=1267768 RepID=A0A1U7DLH8_9RHOB|nr:RNA polymerase subunit sigma [Brevirhabdus pacifica]OWU78298.1 RNA polymerase sigma factor [Loktanella sp. 22II-4b]
MELKALENLIARVALGDRSAFSSLYDATAPKLLGVCLRVLKQRSVAEDALQDAYVKIWKGADRYVSNGLSPMTWLITIARNCAIDRLRASRRDVGSEIDTVTETLAASGPSPEQSAIAGSEARRITSCLDELEATRGEAIRGAYLKGESYSDLAAKFDVPLNTMRTWLRRGLISLRECMER